MIFPFKDIRIRVAAIIIEDNKILLVAHRKNNEIYWLLPGGGVDYGESLEEALTRELEEELNISIVTGEPEIICDSIDPSGKRHVVNLCFRASRVSGELQVGAEKRLHGYDFFDADSLKNITVYPPINSELCEILKGRSTKTYLGKKWQS